MLLSASLLKYFDYRRSLLMKRAGILTAGLTGVSMLTSFVVFAQNPQQPKERTPGVVVRTDNIVVNTSGPDDVLTEPGLPPFAAGVKGQNTFVFVGSEFSFDGKVVKNAPYSGDAVTETTQTLSDGNRIVRKNTASVYRDSEGRTRREQSIIAIGPYSSANDVPQSIVINDPVAGTSYMLDSRSRTARKLGIKPLPFNFKVLTAPGAPAAPGVSVGPNVMFGPGTATAAIGSFGPEDLPVPPPPPASGAMVVEGKGSGSVVNERVMTYERIQGPEIHTQIRVGTNGPSGHAPKVESLGKQLVEGVEADGTRTTVTIPAGEIGNERPIDIVDERWYSPELQTLVLSKRTDPMSGDMTYRLTNINRNEPVRSLFEVPSDYKIKEGPGVTEFRRAPKPPEDK